MDLTQDNSSSFLQGRHGDDQTALDGVPPLQPDPAFYTWSGKYCQQPPMDAEVVETRGVVAQATTMGVAL